MLLLFSLFRFFLGYPAFVRIEYPVLASAIMQQSSMTHPSSLVILWSCTLILLSSYMNLIWYELELFMCWQCCHARSVGKFVMFLGSMLSVLSVCILTVIDTFLFKLIRFQFPLNPISGLSHFNFVSVLKCKSENRRGFILTDPVHFHP